MDILVVLDSPGRLQNRLIYQVYKFYLKNLMLAENGTGLIYRFHRKFELSMKSVSYASAQNYYSSCEHY